MGGAFLLLVTSLLIGSLTKPEYPPFALSAASPVAVGDSLVGPATYTLDASATDRWRRFDFGRNAVVEAGPLDSVVELPVASYAANASAPDTTNPAVGKWYEYSMLSHLLTSKHHVYGVRTPPGKYAKLELLAYYCRDAGTACITFRYAYQGNGTRRVAR